MRIEQAALVITLAAGCGSTSGKDWVSDLPDGKLGKPVGHEGWKGSSGLKAQPSDLPEAPDTLPEEEGGAEEAIAVRDLGDGVPRAVIAHDDSDQLFRNTYYDFPREGGGEKASTVFDAACAPIAKVTTDFHDRVCVQGSGRISSGATVSFAKRGCACAALCPRTGQRICFERLDPHRFPHGRGATGKAITPLRTVAVDSTVIPLGTLLFIPEFVGLPHPDGTKHDGCFLAEDRGLKVVGKQIDVFTGDPALTTQWNALLPSNRGVHVAMNDPRCKAGN